MRKLLAGDEASPQTRGAGTPTRSTPSVCSLLMTTVHGQHGPFSPASGSGNWLPRSLPPFRFPHGLLRSLGRVRAVFLVPCLPASRWLPAPQEGADVGLEEVKSTSAALLWSLVIQKANGGESTGKKREEEKPQETFCTIPRNREAFRQATAIPLKPETWRCAGPPSGAGKGAAPGRLGMGFPAPTIPWEQSQVPESLEPGAPRWLEVE